MRITHKEFFMCTNILELQAIAADIRRSILRLTHNAGCGHTGGSLSEADILTALFFHIMRIDPQRPDWDQRDRFILSKGHATPGYYAVLAERGYFSKETLLSFDQLGSPLQGHPDSLKTAGVDVSTGSLGQGLSLGIGIRLGLEQNRQPSRVFVLMGDGECQEGQIWEAALYAGARQTKNLIAITDYNKVQLSAKLDETLSLEPLGVKWESFGWRVLNCDGNEMTACVETLEEACRLSATGPVMVLAHTIKGKGVSFMEESCLWHGKAPNDEEFKSAMEEIENG